MRSVQARIDPDGPEPLVVHWSKAETANIRDAYNSAIARHSAQTSAWATPRWFDLLTEVIRAEPVVVQGALGFGLKQIAQALHRHDLIETSWQDGPGDGLGAMVGAWSCAAEAARRSVPLGEIELMRQISRYNEIDCKVMMEIVRLLHVRNHTYEAEVTNPPAKAGGFIFAGPSKGPLRDGQRTRTNVEAHNLVAAQSFVDQRARSYVSFAGG